MARIWRNLRICLPGWYKSIRIQNINFQAPIILLMQLVGLIRVSNIQNTATPPQENIRQKNELELETNMNWLILYESALGTNVTVHYCENMQQKNLELIIYSKTQKQIAMIGNFLFVLFGAIRLSSLREAQASVVLWQHQPSLRLWSALQCNSITGKALEDLCFAFFIDCPAWFACFILRVSYSKFVNIGSFFFLLLLLFYFI